jgi:hypothetical protein
MSWPPETSPSRYPGIVQRDMTLTTTAGDGRLVLGGALRDRWSDDATGEVEEIHSYQIRLEAELPELTVVSVDVQPGYLPFPACPAAAAAAGRLIGLRLTDGFRRGAIDALGGTDGCTHLLNLVLAIANQLVVANYLRSRVDPESTPESRQRREKMVDACCGWQEGGLGIALARAGRPVPRSTVQQRERFTAQAEHRPRP